MKRAIIALVLLLVIGLAVAKLFVLEMPRIGGNDMAPTLQRGDIVLVYRLDQTPRRGDLVLIEPPGGGPAIIRRVIALPGERVEVKGEVPIVDGRRATREIIAEVQLPDPGAASGRPMKLVRESIGPVSYRVLKDPRRRSVDFPEVALGEQVFVMADNRNHGTGSRTFGPVAADRVRGVVTHLVSPGAPSVVGGPERPGWSSLRPRERAGGVD